MSNRISGDDNIPPLRNRRNELQTYGAAAEAVLWKHLQRRQEVPQTTQCEIAIELDGALHFSELGEAYEAQKRKSL